jgi:hypothetical protein
MWFEFHRALNIVMDIRSGSNYVVVQDIRFLTSKCFVLGL